MIVVVDGIEWVIVVGAKWIVVVGEWAVVPVVILVQTVIRLVHAASALLVSCAWDRKNTCR